MPRKNTAVQLMSAMRRLFHKGYQSIILTSGTLEVTPDGALVVNTKPLAKDVQGYGGPVPLKAQIRIR